MPPFAEKPREVAAFVGPGLGTQLTSGTITSVRKGSLRKTAALLGRAESADVREIERLTIALLCLQPAVIHVDLLPGWRANRRRTHGRTLPGQREGKK